MDNLKFDLNDFRTDTEAKEQGVWIDFGGGAEFKIASLDSVAFTEAFRKATKPYNDLGRKVPEADQIAIMCRCMAQFVLLDWKNVYDGDKELPYSTEAAEKVLTELEWVRDKVIAAAKDLDNFKARKREEAGKP